MPKHIFRVLGSAWLLAGCFCLLAGPSGAAVLVSYEHYVYATGSDGVPISADVDLPGATQWWAEITKAGSAGNYGYVRYGCDLATGRVRTYAFSRGVIAEFWPYGFTATGRAVQNRMVDEITFTVPAGTYPEGVTATLRGTFRGSIWSEIGAGCQFTAYANLGEAVFQLTLQAVGIDVEDTIVFDEILELTTQLVPPGGTLNQATEYKRTVSA